jgi:hypothetical protein
MLDVLQPAVPMARTSPAVVKKIRTLEETDVKVGYSWGGVAWK